MGSFVLLRTWELELDPSSIKRKIRKKDKEKKALSNIRTRYSEICDYLRQSHIPQKVTIDLDSWYINSKHKHKNKVVTSIIGLVDRILLSIAVSFSLPATVAKYLIAYLALTVLPAPLSPDTIILWFRPIL